MMRDGRIKVPVPPPLSDAQREAAYQASLALRQARAGLKADLKAGAVQLADCFEWDWVQTMKVIDLLRAMPGFGVRKAHRLLNSLRIAENRTVAQLGPIQRKAVLQKVTQLENRLEPARIFAGK